MSRLRRHAAALGVLVIGVLLPAGATAAAPPAAPTIGSHPPEVSGSGDAAFGFSYPSEATFWCQLDSAGFSHCDGQAATSGSETYSNLEDGSHTFDVKAVHEDDEPSDAASWTWEIDRKPPPPPTIDLKPSNPSNDRSPAFRFSDSEQSATFECRLDSGDFSDCSSPRIYTIPAGPEGAHTFRVRAVDKAKNRSDVTRYTWRIDLKPPPAPSISSAPANPTTATNATFAFADTESPVAFRCQFDGGGFSGCASPVTYSGLSAIPHVFSVQATDRAGNTGATTSYAWSVIAVRDTTAPGEVTGLRRSIGYRVLKLEWARPADPDFDYVRILVGKGSKAAKGQLRTSVYKGIGTHYTNKRLQNGTYYRYSIVSYDKAGNASKGMTVVVQPSILLRAPRVGAAIHAPPRLAWAKVPKATFYNVQLFFRGRKVLSAWPSAAKLGLKQRWSYANRRFKLKPGTYHWFVWPAFGTRAKSRYGQLLGQSGFTVR